MACRILGRLPCNRFMILRKILCQNKIVQYICPASQKRGILKGRLAQLVQSTCLTSRGSLVRIQYRPQLKSTSIHGSGFIIIIGWHYQESFLRGDFRQDTYLTILGIHRSFRLLLTEQEIPDFPGMQDPEVIIPRTEAGQVNLQDLALMA